MEITFETEIKTEIAPENIDDILVTAFEGGINYWCRKVKIIKFPENLTEGLASEILAHGGELKLFDAETEEFYVLTLPKFLEGLKKYMVEYQIFSIDQLIEIHDADTADIIVQYALFNELVFC